jgi:hypothetical protein
MTYPGPSQWTFKPLAVIYCGLATVLINLTIPGPGNTLALTLGKPTFGR